MHALLLRMSDRDAMLDTNCSAPSGERLAEEMQLNDSNVTGPSPEGMTLGSDTSQASRSMCVVDVAVDSCM